MEVDGGNYFPEQHCNQYDWVRNPFIESAVSLSSNQQDALLGLSSDRTLKTFDSNTLPEFWLSVETEYAELERLAIDILLPFASTWPSEATFSILTYIKSKYRSRLLTVDDNLWIGLVENPCLTVSAPVSFIEGHQPHCLLVILTGLFVFH
ncbi:protein FAM200B [Pimephales promelas]|nr:protein FAM200B [Pimephales promelas]